MGRRDHVLLGVVDQDVQRLQDDRDPLGLDDLRPGLERVDHGLSSWASRACPSDSSPATTQSFFTPSFSATGRHRLELGEEVVLPRGVGDPPVGRELGRREAQLLVEPGHRVDVLAGVRPELVVGEPGLGDLAEAIEHRELGEGHLDVDRVGQPGPAPRRTSARRPARSWRRARARRPRRRRTGSGVAIPVMREAPEVSQIEAAMDAESGGRLQSCASASPPQASRKSTHEDHLVRPRRVPRRGPRAADHPRPLQVARFRRLPADRRAGRHRGRERTRTTATTATSARSSRPSRSSEGWKSPTAAWT